MSMGMGFPMEILSATKSHDHECAEVGSGVAH